MAAKWPTPFDIMTLQGKMSLLAAESCAVVWMRSMGMAGLWNTASDENIRMVTEKQQAMMQAGLEAWAAAMAGKPPHKVVKKSMKPVRRKVRANRKRLTRRGPVRTL